MSYVYTYTCRIEEQSLCKMEQRSLFGMESDFAHIESSIDIDPSRSPFIKERIAIQVETSQLDEMVERMNEVQCKELTYKVIFISNLDDAPEEKVGFKERQAIARKVGSAIDGRPDLDHPDKVFGIMHVNGRWVFGEYMKSDVLWLHHQKKPESYSTALSTRLARAIVNIAIPNPTGVKAIDPCCGMGTVLVEACSMGIDIVGSDINRVVIPGARSNLQHFGLECEVKRQNIKDITEHFDVAIIDMPYNICCVATPEEQQVIIGSAYQIANKVVFITIEAIDELVLQAGFAIVDRCIAKKGNFERQIILCERE